MLTFCKNDADWSVQVNLKHGGHCMFCGGKATPAHIFSRKMYSALRLVLENGVPLCVKHHNWFDSLSIENRRVAAMTMIGPNTFEELEINKGGVSA